MSVYALVVFTGFLGSFHCAAMCGPFVGYYSLGGKASFKRHGAYHLGRLTAYLALGALAGTLGQGVLLAGVAVGLQQWLMVLMGVVMIAVGISYYLPGKARAGKFSLRTAVWLRNLTGEVNGTERAALLGLLTTLLPCGYLHAYALAAMVSGHPLNGMLTMGAFWLGTAPSLLGVGLAGNLLSAQMSARLSRLTPLLLMLLGLLAVSGKWTALPGGPVEHFFCRP